jgi:hypothetical protein
MESFRPLEPSNLSGHAELFTAMCGGEIRKKFTAKHLAEHRAWKEEPFPAADPGRAVGSESSGGNQAV